MHNETIDPITLNKLLEEKDFAPFVSGVMMSVATSQALQKKTDRDMALLLVDYIWPDYELFGWKSDVISEAINRLYGKCHINR